MRSVFGLAMKMFGEGRCWLIVAVAALICGCAGPRPSDQTNVGLGAETAPGGPSGGQTEATAPPEQKDGSDSPDVPAAAPVAQAPATPPRQRITLVPGVTVVRGGEAAARCEIDAVVCLNEGWLEQVACSPGTREHEALFVIEAPARALHTALLVAGFEPGRPGRWTFVERDGFQFHPPEGTPLRVLVRGVNEPTEAARPVNEWIIAEESGEPLPDLPFVFGGSTLLIPRTASGEPPVGEGDEIYAAEISGSLIGLVTFGDEVVGYQRIIADQSEIMPQEWVADSRKVPPIGTRVVLILTRYDHSAVNADAAAAVDGDSPR